VERVSRGVAVRVGRQNGVSFLDNLLLFLLSIGLTAVIRDIYEDSERELGPIVDYL
jgi:hypothetical protein